MLHDSDRRRRLTDGRTRWLHGCEDGAAGGGERAGYACCCCLVVATVGVGVGRRKAADDDCAADFKNHNDLPLARIKRIMKSDEDVRMISAEAPVLFAKACEMFILELTLRSWGYSEKNKRRTLQKEDIQTAIRNTDIFDFLVDVIN